MSKCNRKNGDDKVISVPTTLMKILMELMGTLQDITESADAHLYIMINDKLYRIFKGHCTAYPTGWKPGPGTIPVALAAYTKTYFLSNDGVTKDKFKYGIGRMKNAELDKILCIPVSDPNGKVFSVIELSRNINNPPYEKDEIDMALTVCSWANTVVYRNSSKSLITRDDTILNDCICIMDKYVSSSIDFTSYIITTMEYIEKTIEANGVIYSEILNVDPYIVLDYYRKDINSNLEKSHKKRCLDESERGVFYSLVTGDIYRRTEVSKKLTKESEQQENSLTKPTLYDSVLYCPVFELKRPAGIAMFWKKNAETGFTWYDELVCSNVISALLITNNIHRLSERNFLKGLMCNNIFHMVIHQLKPSNHEYAMIEEITSSQPKFPNNFFKFTYYPPNYEPGMNLIKYSLNMFKVVLGQRFLQKNPRLGEFIIMVANNYRDMYYHNFLHAFITMHAMFNVIIRNKDKFFPIEVVSLLVATICHDMDHPGVSNAYLKLIDSYMWQLYEEPPTLEFHHAFFALYLIQHCQLFNYMKKEKYKQITQNVRAHILATDLTSYFKIKVDLFELIKENGFQWTDPEHRERFKCILMTMCDLGGCFKLPEDAVKITSNLYSEFYAQGDKEKKRGVVPLTAMDRTMADSIPQGQVTFITMICFPCFDFVREIVPNCDEIITSTQRLLDFWKRMAENKTIELEIYDPEL